MSWEKTGSLGCGHKFFQEYSNMTSRILELTGEGIRINSKRILDGWICDGWVDLQTGRNEYDSESRWKLYGSLGLYESRESQFGIY